MQKRTPVPIRFHLADLPPYTPIEPFEVLSEKLNFPVDKIVKLDANENPYGITDKIRHAIQNMSYAHIYPDPESRALRQALVNYSGIPENNILAGAGADELIDLIMRVFLSPGDYILNFPPTFGMYAFDTLVNAGKVVDVRRNKDFSIDFNAVMQAYEEYKPRLVFIANPNNPDGSLIEADLLKRLLELPVLVVLDEAYIEFAVRNGTENIPSHSHEVLARDNLIILRTFSKWAGLAGLRIGYGFFPDWIMPTLWKAKQPYNVNVAASTAALAALDDLQTLLFNLNMILEERKNLLKSLEEIPFLDPYPSQANFILCKVLGIDASELKNILAEKYGILIRYFNKPGLQDHVRITVGTKDQIQALLVALYEIGKEL